MAESDFFDALERKIDGITTPAQLEEVRTAVLATVNKMLTDAQDQMSKLQPLMTPPTTLPTLIIWAKAMIDTFVKPYETLLQKITLYTERIARLQSKISQKASELTGGV